MAAPATARFSSRPSAGARSSTLAHLAPSPRVATRTIPSTILHLNIQGYALGAKGLPEGAEATPDNTLFTMVDTSLEIGTGSKEQLRMPIISGALGSTEIARANWEHFAVGAAISGVVLTCGENVCGIDPGLAARRQRQDRRVARDASPRGRLPPLV